MIVQVSSLWMKNLCNFASRKKLFKKLTLNIYLPNERILLSLILLYFLFLTLNHFCWRNFLTEVEGLSIYQIHEIFQNYDYLPYETQTYMCLSRDKRDKVLKNDPSKICARQPLKNFKWAILEYFVPNVLLNGLFLNILSQMFFFRKIFSASHRVV